MNSYEIVLTIIQVVILGIIFGLSRRYGKKVHFYIIGIILISSLVAIIYHQMNKEKPIEEMTLNELFLKYTTTEQQKQCGNKSDICKEFYVGNALANLDMKLSIKYLILAYEHKVSDIIDDKKASKANIATSIAKLYQQKEPNGIQSSEWYEKSISHGAKENLCVLGEIYMNINQLEKAKNLFIQGDMQNLSVCSSHLGQIYFNEKNKDGIALWLKAYMQDPYGKEINFYLGKMYEQIGELEKAKYHYTVSEHQYYKKSINIIYNEKFKNLDVSHLFIDGILKEQNFKIDELNARFEAFMNIQKEWEITSTPNTYVDILGSNLLFSNQSIRLIDIIDDKNIGLGLNELTIKKLYELIYGQTPIKIDIDQNEKISALDNAIKQDKDFQYEGTIDEKFNLVINYSSKDKKMIYEIKVKKK